MAISPAVLERGEPIFAAGPGFAVCGVRSGTRAVNSLLNLAVALNQRSYAKLHNIESGPDWSIEISKN